MGQVSELADPLHAGKHYFETDATALKNALQISDQDLARHGVLFHEAKFLLHTSFISFLL